MQPFLTAKWSPSKGTPTFNDPLTVRKHWTNYSQGDAGNCTFSDGGYLAYAPKEEYKVTCPSQSNIFSNFAFIQAPQGPSKKCNQWSNCHPQFNIEKPERRDELLDFPFSTFMSVLWYRSVKTTARKFVLYKWWGWKERQIYGRKNWVQRLFGWERLSNRLQRLFCSSRHLKRIISYSSECMGITF